MIDRYQIIGLLEKDQLGSVYLAQDTTLQRKVVYRSFEEALVEEKPEGFSQYTGKLCALQHPNMLTIYDIAATEGNCYMVTQFLEGESLLDRLSKGALNQVGVHNMACDLLDALHAAHASGMYHGAMRTDSVQRLSRVRGGHRYLIVDFGLDRISTMICGHQVIMADPALMAPELHLGEAEANAKTDLFTLGQLCYIALVGGHPYAEKTPEECVQAYSHGGLPHLHTYIPDVQEDFANWVMWLVSGNPKGRPSSSDEAMSALHSISLKADSPNVPGVTQAVIVPDQVTNQLPPLLDTGPVKPTRKSTGRVAREAQMQPAQPSQANTPKAAASKTSEKSKISYYQGRENKERRVMAAAVATILVLLMVLILAFVFRDQSDSSEAENAAPQMPLAEMLNPRLITQFHSGQAAGEARVPVVVLESPKVLDWTVITGVPASTRRSMKKQGSYIRNIMAIGSFAELNYKTPMVSYRVGGSDIVSPRLGTNHQQGNAKVGEGWKVIVRIPENHQGPLKVIFYMQQRNCDIALEVHSDHESDQRDVVRLKVAASKPGVVEVPVEITEPRPGYYSFSLLVGSQSAIDGFEMGLSAVVLERF